VDVASVTQGTPSTNTATTQLASGNNDTKWQSKTFFFFFFSNSHRYYQWALWLPTTRVITIRGKVILLRWQKELSSGLKSTLKD